MLSVLKGLCVRDERTRLASVNELFNFLEGGHFERIRYILLEQLIHDPCSSIRLETLSIISDHFNMLISPDNVGSFFETLHDLLEDDRQPMIRISAAFLLGKCELFLGSNRVCLQGRLSKGQNERESSSKKGPHMEDPHKKSAYNKEGLYKETLSVSEAAFIALGVAIGDVLEEVRELACKLLGGIKVSDSMCCQLLSKEADPHEFVSITGSTLKLPWCFRGNFILALEDEYKRVRLAAIKAMREHSIRSMAFAEKALDFFIDSLQDEALIVRVAALESVAKVCAAHRIPCTVERLEAILSHLDDTEEDSREVTRSAVATLCCLVEEEQILKIARCFPLAIQKFPAEAAAHYGSLCQVGRNNGSLIKSTVHRLLKTDKFFLTPEPNVEDTTYNVRLAIILGALSESPDFLGALPLFVRKHYQYLYIRYPNMIPDFRGHPLEGRFWTTLDETRAKPIVLCAQTSLMQRIALIIRGTALDRVSEGVEANLKYNGYGFSTGLLLLLNNIIACKRKGKKLTATSVLSPFVDVDEEVELFVERLLSPTDDAIGDIKIPRAADLKPLTAAISGFNFDQIFNLERCKDVSISLDVVLNHWTGNNLFLIVDRSGVELTRAALTPRFDDLEFWGKLVISGEELPEGVSSLRLTVRFEFLGDLFTISEPYSLHVNLK